MKADSLLTDISCSCSTCTCSNDIQNKIKSDYFENNDDCLAYIFIILYESSRWCIQIIYELFFKSLWQVLIYIKQELQYNQNDNRTISNMDMISINNSASRNYPLICKKKNYTKELSRYHLSLLEARNRKDKIIFSNKTSSQQIDNFSIDTQIVIVPVRSSYCQTEIPRNDLQTINIDLNQSEKNINLHEQLTETSHRRLHEPLIFMNREICCRQNQTPFFSTVPSNIKKIHSGQTSSNEKQELSPFNHGASPVYSANQNNKLSTTSGFPVSNTLNESSSPLLSDPTDKTLFLNNSQPFFSGRQQRKLSQKKNKQKRRIIDNNSIPLALATSLHSNVSLYNVDYFLTKLFTDKYHLR